MENLINDSSFEVYHNSEGLNMLDNRVLTTYPSELNSFQVFLGFDGEVKKKKWWQKKDKKSTSDTSSASSNTSPVQAVRKPEKIKVNPEKVAEGITALAGATGSVVSTVQAFKGDGTKPKSSKKQLRDVCGRKPVFSKSKKKSYNTCVEKYRASLLQNLNPKSEMPIRDREPNPNKNDDSDLDKKDGNIFSKNKKIIIGVLVVGLVVFFAYKKGLIFKKAGN